MSRIEGGLGQCFDTVRMRITGDDSFRGLIQADEAEQALDNIEEAFERRQRWAHDARGLAHRLTGMIELEVKWLRAESSTLAGSMDTMFLSDALKKRSDELETRLLTELGSMSFDKMSPKALVELCLAVAATLERRGITAFPVQLGGDGKIQGPVDG